MTFGANIKIFCDCFSLTFINDSRRVVYATVKMVMSHHKSRTDEKNTDIVINQLIITHKVNQEKLSQPTPHSFQCEHTFTVT